MAHHLKLFYLTITTETIRTLMDEFQLSNILLNDTWQERTQKSMHQSDTKQR